MGSIWKPFVLFLLVSLLIVVPSCLYSQDSSELTNQYNALVQKYNSLAQQNNDLKQQYNNLLVVIHGLGVGCGVVSAGIGIFIRDTGGDISMLKVRLHSGIVL